MKKNMFGIVMLTAGALMAAVPEVSDVRMTQAADRVVTIRYKLTGGPAVVTLDVQTNSADGVWTSIGGANISGGVAKGVPQGDVFRVVQGGEEDCVITWRPAVSWPDHKVAAGNARAVVSAWAMNDTPDYLVVDLGYQSDVRCRYYPSAEFLPGGLLTNPAYRTSKMVMRKIRAKNVSWTMGYDSVGIANERTHSVMLDRDYYMGVFEVTKAQFEPLKGSVAGLSVWCYQYFAVDGAMRPQERVVYNDIRSDLTGQTDCSYPADPAAGSWLGLLRSRTGVDFDLPSEAQWEYACRAGYDATFWGDGNSMASSPVPSRYFENGGNIAKDSNQVQATFNGITTYLSTYGATNGTAVCGSYAPNAWGLYDMHGNVREWCLDWYREDITELNGAVCTDSTSAKRVARGGHYGADASLCRATYRLPQAPGGDSRGENSGFRVMCYAGLE